MIFKKFMLFSLGILILAGCETLKTSKPIMPSEEIMNLKRVGD